MCNSYCDQCMVMFIVGSTERGRTGGVGCDKRFGGLCGDDNI